MSWFAYLVLGLVCYYVIVSYGKFEGFAWVDDSAQEKYIKSSYVFGRSFGVMGYSPTDSAGEYNAKTSQQQMKPKTVEFWDELGTNGWLHNNETHNLVSIDTSPAPDSNLARSVMLKGNALMTL